MPADEQKAQEIPSPTPPQAVPNPDLTPSPKKMGRPKGSKSRDKRHLASELQSQAESLTLLASSGKPNYVDNGHKAMVAVMNLAQELSERGVGEQFLRQMERLMAPENFVKMEEKIQLRLLALVQRVAEAASGAKLTLVDERTGASNEELEAEKKAIAKKLNRHFRNFKLA